MEDIEVIVGLRDELIRKSLIATVRTLAFVGSQMGNYC